MKKILLLLLLVGLSLGFTGCSQYESFEYTGYVHDSVTDEPLKGVQVGVYMSEDSIRENNITSSQYIDEEKKIVLCSYTDENGYFKCSIIEDAYDTPYRDGYFFLLGYKYLVIEMWGDDRDNEINLVKE